jgi:hypothetical protein
MPMTTLATRVPALIKEREGTDEVGYGATFIFALSI